MTSYRTLFLTERGAFHQQQALEAAPPDLDITVIRWPERSQLLPLLQDVELLISERTGVVDAEMIAAAPNLRMILRLGSLAYDIDLEAARSKGIVVALRRQEGVIRVAEHLMMQMLALVKRLREVQALALEAGEWAEPRRTDEDTFAYNWTHRQNIEGLQDKTIGILGFGEIGAELARRLGGWDSRLVYHRRRRLPETVEDEMGLNYTTQEAVLAESDFLVNLLPYFPQTDMLLNRERLSTLKQGACVVSCGSGSVLDEQALADMYRSGHLAGVALDTFEFEPIRPDNPLRLLAREQPDANVVLTPHTAAGAPRVGDWLPRSREYEPIMAFLRGEKVPGRLA